MTLQVGSGSGSEINSFGSATLVESISSYAQEIHEMFAQRGPSTRKVPARLLKVGPDQFLNATSAHSDTDNYRLGQIPNRVGQPYPVFKTKWG